MSEIQEKHWLVQVKPQNGHLSAEKYMLDPNQITEQFNDLEQSTTIIQAPGGSLLASAIISTHGELPPGFIPFLNNITDFDTHNLSLNWVCLGYFIPKSNSVIPGNFPKQSNHQSQPDNESGDDNGATITQPQKRYLFRLLVQKNIKGTDAEEYLKKSLSVDDLNQASRKRASQLIDQMLREGGESQ